MEGEHTEIVGWHLRKGIGSRWGSGLGCVAVYHCLVVSDIDISPLLKTLPHIGNEFLL